MLYVETTDGITPSNKEDLTDDALSEHYLKTKELFRQTAEIDGVIPTTSLSMAGDISIDQAFSTTDIEERARLIDQARRYWEEDLRGSIASCNSVSSPHAEKSARQLACLPLYNRLLMLGEMPEKDSEMAGQTYADLLRIGSQIISDGWPDDHEKRVRLIGSLNELSVLTLLTRFALKTNTEHQFLTLPSLYSEDHSLQHSEQWDISVFTRYDEAAPILQTYKIQIKSSYFQRQTFPRSYDEDISVVYVRSNLSPQQGYTLRPTDIMRDCLQEARGDKRAKLATQRLDVYCEKLLDIIDQH